MKLPEVKLKAVLDHLLDWITKDFSTAPTEQDSFLYQTLHGNTIDNFDFYEQGKNIFLRTSDNPRKLETRIMFDPTRAEIPTIHIVLSSESTGKDNSIGVNRGRDNFKRSDNKIQPIYERSFDARFQLAITSNNPMETVLIYQCLKAVLIAGVDSLILSNLRLPSLSGDDLELSGEQIPSLFVRSLTVEVDYEMAVPSLQSYEVLNKIIIQDAKIEK